MTDFTFSPDEITQRGEKIYTERLKSELEPAHIGEYVVIEVESGDHFVNRDLVVAINEARAKYPGRLFYTIQVGTKPTISHRKTNYAWEFR